MITMNYIAKRSLLAFCLLCVVTWIVVRVADVQGKDVVAVVSNTTDNDNKTVTDSSAKRAQTPTFSKEVVRVLQKNCQSCHHPGDIAPFSLMTYQEARPWAKAIREQVLTQKMPPWKPVPGCGDFRDARALTQEEINTLVNWVDSGAPEGNSADLPAPQVFPDGWSQGEPDFIATPETSYTPPQGKDTYRCFSVPTASLRGDRYIQGLDVRPGNRRIVHHVIAYADPQGQSVALDAKDPGPGYNCTTTGPGFPISFSVNDLLSGKAVMLGGWAPGSRGYFSPEGVGIKLPGNAPDRVVVQVHYHPTDEPEADLTSVGFYFARKPVLKAMMLLPLVNTTFSIPPGAKNHEVTQTFDVPSLLSGKIIGITPHMHLLGKQIKVEMTRPGEAAQCLVNIPSWDFNWQGSYLYQNPIAAPGGSRLKLTCVFDNSSDNPYNPSKPPITVRWGEETTDEMALAFIASTVDAFSLTPSTPQLASATVNAQGQLAVSGTGFLPGADIEINGRTLRDTAASGSGLVSSELWKVLAEPGKEASVTVLNPDGVRTAAVKFTRTGTAKSLATVSAASFAADALAPEAIVAAFGTGLATAVQVANSTPLPTQLAGTSVRVNGVLAPLFFVAPTQVNFLIPGGTTTGSAVIEILSGDTTLSRGTVTLAATAPSLFTANASGAGAPAAVVTKDGVNYSPAGNVDGTPNVLDVGDYLVLFGSGLRRASTTAMRITIGGKDAPVLFNGAQGGYAGLDQINTQIPTGISGVVDVIVSINGKAANTVKVRVR